MVILLVDEEIGPSCKPGTTGEIDHSTQPFQKVLFGDDVDDTDLAFRIVLSGGSRDNLNILDLPGRNLLKRLSA